MKFFNRVAARRSRNAVVEYGRLLAHPRHIYGYWWRGLPNFGDALSPVILRWISGRTVLNIDYLPMHRGPVYLAVGSILDGLAIKDAIIWGSGFLSSGGRMTKEPRRVLATRGPLTRQKLLDQGVSCPEVYGDPGLLVRRMFDFERTEEFEYGIVPHIDDKGLLPPHLVRENFVNLIDVQSQPVEFVREVCRCKRILSSSLHGLITADAFGIPSAQFCLSDHIIMGGSFKFNDYCLSVGRELVPPIDMTKIKRVEDMDGFLVLADVEPTINRLLESSPFPQHGHDLKPIVVSKSGA